MFKRYKETVLFFSLLVLCGQVNAQLAGNYSVPMTYPSIAAAINALNAQGVSAPVFINISSGYTETAPVGGYSLTATGTSANPITFRKAGIGANPLITAYAGGSGTPGTAVQDGVWRLIGSDYITIDGIDINDPGITNPASMEYGYGFFKANTGDGCQYNTIQNCVVSLKRVNNATGAGPAADGSRAINVVNSLSTTQTTAMTPISFAGTNSYNKFYNNTLQNCNIGIALIGYAASSPFTLADVGNEIGSNLPSTGNSILNFGGAAAATNPAAGIRTLAQYNLSVLNNVINNNTGVGVSHVSTLRGIYLNTAMSANASVSGNSITLVSAANTAVVAAIENVSGATAANNTITISNNQITNCTNSVNTTGSFYGIFNNAASPSYLIITNNVLSGINTKATTGANYGIYNTGAVGTMAAISNNLISASSNAASTSGAFYGIYSNAISSAWLNMSANTLSNVNVYASTGAVYGLYNSSATSNSITIQNNALSSCLFSITSTGNFFGISNNGSGTAELNMSLNSIQNNTLSLFSGPGYYVYNSGSQTNSILLNSNTINNSGVTVGSNAAFYGIYNNTASSQTLSLSNNSISNFSISTQNGSNYLMYNSGALTTTYNVLAMNNNLVNNCNFSAVTGGAFYSIWNNGVRTQSTSISTNTISNSNWNSATALNYGIANFATATGLVNLNSNLISNCSFTNNTTASYYAIYNNNTSTVSTGNLSASNNTFTNIYRTASSGETHFINVSGVTSNTYTSIDVNNNLISSESVTISAAGPHYGIYNNTASTNSLSINSNSFTNNFISASAGPMHFIYNRGVAGSVFGSVNFNSNLISGITSTINSNGSFYGLFNSAVATTTSGSLQMNANTFTNTNIQVSTGPVYLFYSTCPEDNGITITNNLIGNVTNSNSSSGAFYGINNSSNSSAGNLLISNNTFTNLNSTASTGNRYLVYNGGGITNSISIANNLITSCNHLVSGNASYYGINNNSAFSGLYTGILTNTLSSNTSTLTTGSTNLILNSGALTTSISTVELINNSIDNYTGTATSGAFSGIANTGITAVNLSMNTNSLTNINLNAASSLQQLVLNSARVTNSIAIAANLVSNYTNTLNTTGTYYAINNSISYANGNYPLALTIGNNRLLNTSLNSSTGTIYFINNSGVNTNTIVNCDISANTISGHTHTVTSAGSIFGINNSALSNSVLSVSGNTLTNIVSTSTSSTRYMINSSALVLSTEDVVNNLFSNYTNTVNTSGSFYDINSSGNSQGNLSVKNNIFLNHNLNASSGSLFVINNTGIIAGSVDMSSNFVSGFIHSASAAGGFYGISNNAGSSSSLLLSSNTFTNLNLSTVSGPTHFLYNRAAVAGTIGVITVSNTSVGSFSYTSNSGPFYGIYNLGSSYNVMIVANNSFTGIVPNSVSASRYFIYNTGIGLSSATLSVLNNLISGFSATANTSGNFYGILNTGSTQGLVSVVSNSLLSLNLNASTGSSYMINNTMPVNSIDISNNLISGVSNICSGTGVFYGIYNVASTSSSFNLANNTLLNLNLFCPTSISYLFYNSGTATNTISSVNFSNNSLTNFTLQSNSGNLFAFYNSNLTSGDLSIINNTITNAILTTTSSSRYMFFNSGPVLGNFNFSNNGINTCSSVVNTTGSYFGFNNGGNCGGSLDMSNNSISNHALSASSGSVLLVYNSGIITNSITILNNTASNFSHAATAASFFYGIYNNAGSSNYLNISSNTFTNISHSTTTGSSHFIYNRGLTTNTISSAIVSNNKLANFTYTASSGPFYGIYNNATAFTSMAVNGNTLASISGTSATGVRFLIYNTGAGLSMLQTSNNLFSGFTNTLNTTGSYNGIYNTGNISGDLIISSNTFSNQILTSSTASAFVIYNGGIISNSISITSNLVSIFSHSSSTSGGLMGIYNNAASSVNLNISSNSFSNISLWSTSGSAYYIFNRAASAGTIGTIGISGNSFSTLNFTTGGGAFYGINNNGLAFSNLSVSGNSFVSVYHSGTTGLRYFITNNGVGAASIDMSNNLISNFTSTANTTGLHYSILNAGACVGNLFINNNSISNLNLTASTASVYIIQNSANITNSISVSNNLLGSVSLTSATGPFYGIINSSAPCAYVSASNNTLSGVSITNSVSPKYLVYNSSGSSGSVFLNGNIISAYTNSNNTTGSNFLIYNTGSSSGDIDLSNNKLNAISLGSSTSALYSIYNTGNNSLGSGAIKLNSNSISGLSFASNSGAFYALYNVGTSAGAMSFNTNTVVNTAITGSTGARAFIYNPANVNGNISFNNNLISAVTISGNINGTVYGLYNSGTSLGNLGMSTNTISNNQFENVSAVNYMIANTASVSGTIFMNDNSVTGYTNSTATSGDFYGVLNTGSLSTMMSMSGNTFSNNKTNITSGNIQLLMNSGSVSGAITFTGNALSQGLTNASTDFSGNFNAIYNSGGSTTSSVNISGNNFSNMLYSGVSGSGNLYFIQNTNNNSALFVNGNVWTGLNINHNGNEHLIFNPSSTQTSLTVMNNSVSGGYTRSGNAGALFLYYSNGNSPATCTQEFSGNNFSNITANNQGTGSFYGLYSNDGQSSPYPKKSVYNNIISNISYNGLGFMYGYYFNFLGDANSTNGSAIYNNTLTSVSWGGPFYGIYSSMDVSPNQPAKIYSNVVQNITSNGQNAEVYGIYLNGGGAGLKCYKNKIADLSSNGTSGTASGIQVAGSAIMEINNNLVGTIQTPSSAVTNPLNGIYIGGSNSLSLYYNTVVLNAVSTGSNFASNALFVSTATNLDLRNNILINNSTSNGTGITCAYRRSTSALTTYSSSSNNNVFYAGIPAANRVLFHDGTTAALTLPSLQTMLNPRESISVSENSPMLSMLGANANYLHINTTIPSLTDNGALNVGGITDDVDLQIRQGNTGYSGVGTAPDIGADEYDGNLTPCLGANAGTIMIPISSVKCSGESVYMLSTGYSAAGAIVHQWKVSNTPGGPYTNVVGGTGANYVAYNTPTLNAGNYYYVLATTCTIGNITAISNEVTVTVNQTPTTSAGISNQPLCAGQDIQLSASSASANNYLWLGPNNFTSTVQNPTVTNTNSNASGIYTLLVSDANCTSSPVYVTATVNPTPPVFSLTPTSASLCAGSSQTIGASIPITSPTLNFGSQTYQNSASGYPSAYSVYFGGQKMQVLILAGELATAGFTVGSPITGLQFTVNSLGGNWGSSLMECKNFKLSIKNTSTSVLSSFENNLIPVLGPINYTPTLGTNLHTFGAPFIWDGTSNVVIETVFSNSIIGTSGNTSIQNNSPTGFQSTLVYRADNQSISTISAATTSNTNVGFVRPDFTLNGSQVGTYSWSPSSGLSGTTGTSVTASPTVSTLYIATLSNGLCASNASMQLNVILIPTITIASTSSVVCLGNNATLTASGATTYTWSTNSTATSVVVSPFVSTNYSVVGSNPACPNASTSIFIQSAPALTLTTNMVPASICQGGTATITASGVNSYTWTGGSNSNSIVVTPSLTTNYQVYGSSGPGCWVSKTVLAKVNPIPFISITPASATICPGQTITLEASGVFSFTWQPNNANSPAIEISPTISTIFTVTGEDQNKCVNTATAAVIVDPCVSIAEKNSEASQMKIFPNPSAGKFEIDFGSEGERTIRITNALGSVIMEGETSKRVEAIDLNSIDKGVYFIRVINSKTEYIQKIIID